MQFVSNAFPVLPLKIVPSPHENVKYVHENHCETTAENAKTNGKNRGDGAENPADSPAFSDQIDMKDNYDEYKPIQTIKLQQVHSWSLRESNPHLRAATVGFCLVALPVMLRPHFNQHIR